MSDHLSDCELVLFMDGELESPAQREHVLDCASCIDRVEQLRRAAAEFDAEYQNLVLPSGVDSRHALLTRMRQQSNWKTVAAAAAAILVIGVAGLLFNSRAEAGDTPQPTLTPGATRAISRNDLCSDEGPALRRVANDVAEQVFRRYGIQTPAPRMYEIDYLIPPDLGGSEDPRNLWPQPYTRGVWNARVKDALEDRLRSMVCDGRIDLATAQRELARDWIGAYKHYFRTDTPLLDHVAFNKDRPWE